MSAEQKENAFFFRFAEPQPNLHEVNVDKAGEKLYLSELCQSAAYLHKAKACKAIEK